MTGTERINDIFGKKAVDRNAFWMGIPHAGSRQAFYNRFGVDNDVDLGLAIGNDLCPLLLGADTWKHPDGQTLFGLLPWEERESLAQDGYFSECENIAEVESFPWPDVKYLDFSDAISSAKKLTRTGRLYSAAYGRVFFTTYAIYLAWRITL